MLRGFEKYLPHFGKTKPACSSVSIPSAWNYGRHRRFAFYVKFKFYERWFDSENEYISYMEQTDKKLVEKVDVYELEL